MNCGPASLNARTACARCLPRGSLPAITTWLLCQMVNKSNCEPLATQLTQDWSDRVVTNSGNPAMRPSVPTFNAVHTFLCTLITNNLHTRMMAMSVLPPDNIWSCITPVLNYGAGLDPWQLIDCASGDQLLPVDFNWDINNSGLFSCDLNNLVTFILNSGYIPSAARVDHGLTGQVTEPSAINTNEVIAGATNDVGHTLEVAGQDPVFVPNASVWSCFDSSDANTNGRIVAQPVPGTATGAGFFSLSRRNNVDFSGYFAQPGSGFPFATIATRNGIVGAPPTFPIFFYGLAIIGNPAFCNCFRMSFCAAHLGYTTSETQVLFNAVQQLRHDLGGGWV